MATEDELRDVIGSPVIIRFDGLDAAAHEMEMADLGESLKGLSRIIAVTGNFAATQKYVQHKDALAVRVIVSQPEAHCFEMVAWLKWGAENPLISTTLGGVFVLLISYVFNRAAGQRAEMRELRGALDLAIKELGNKDQNVVDRLLDTVDKMADALRPAVKQAVAPVGRTAATLTITSPSESEKVLVDAATKAAILSETPIEVGPEQVYQVLITEINFDNNTCRVSLSPESEERVSAQITDPAFLSPNNAYAIAAAARQEITVRGKATIRDGQIERLFISNTMP